MAVSLEVAEHLSSEYADVFVQSLINASKIILFSAAIPKQTGFNHINEQYPTYWIEKFHKYGYVFHDVIRPKIWYNENIEFWYKQNIFIVTKEDVQIEAAKGIIYDLVHPELFIKIQESPITIKNAFITMKNAFSILLEAIKKRLY